jgi:hydrogenase assembly chaperone HypC/HupF
VSADADHAPHCDHEVGCITCGDVAAPVRVLRADGERRLALCVDSGGSRQTVQTELVGPVSVGDTLLVHAGTAISTLDGEPAG